MKTVCMKLVGCAAALAVGVTAVATEVETGTVLGITCVNGLAAETDTAVAVPWLNAAQKDCTVAELITAGLATGDTIKVYDLTARAYYIWAYRDGEWECAGNAPSDQPAATAYVLPRGRAFWYAKSSGNGVSSYTQVGVRTDAAVTTQVSKEATASVFAPTHSLLVNPKWEAFDIATKLTAAAGCVAGDAIVVTATGVRYEFDGTSWGRYAATEVDGPLGGKVVRQVFAALGAGEGIIPAGTAFWYLSAGGQPTIQW